MIPESLLAFVFSALVLFGNLWHFIWGVNITSALGHDETTVSRIRKVLALVFVASSAFLLWESLNQPPWAWALPLRIYGFLCVLSGAIFGPFGGLIHRLSRAPHEFPLRTSCIDLAELYGIENLVGNSRTASLLKIPKNQSFRLRRGEWELDFPGLVPALRGLNIIHLTDLHFAPAFRREFFEAVVEAAREWPADIILLTGDIVDDDAMIAWIKPVLGRLHARFGKFAILGNHDFEHQPETILRELENAGFETLEGKWTTIDVDGATLALGGTSAPWGPGLRPEQTPDADFRILLSHSPDQFPVVRDWGIDLIFAGHNHGGQIRFPIVGPVFMPSRYSRRFDRGFFRSGSTLMFVSEGVAGKHPVRFGSLPEIGRFVLQLSGSSFHRSHVHPVSAKGESSSVSRSGTP